MNYLLFFSDGGQPKPDLTPVIITYVQVADGTPVEPAPEIEPLAGGGYKFSAVPAADLYVEVDGGAALADADRYKALRITPQDGALDAPVSSRSTPADLNNLPEAAGKGALTWSYTLTRSDNGLPIADADVWIATDVTGVNIIASGRTDQNGVVTFYLDAGTVYVFRQKSGFNFMNPDQAEVS